MMGPNWGHMAGWATVWSWVFLGLVIVGLVVLIIVLLRGFAPRDSRQLPSGSQSNRARELLDERYARGEIDTSEYDERRQRLDRSSDE